MVFDYLFTNLCVKILRMDDSSVAFTGRLISKFYLVDFRTSKLSPGTFLVTKYDKGWL
jgi:hypothetical protein